MKKSIFKIIYSNIYIEITYKTHEMIYLHRSYIMIYLHCCYIVYFLVLNVLKPIGVFDFFDHRKEQNFYMNVHYPNLENHILLSKKYLLNKLYLNLNLNLRNNIQIT